MDGDTWTGAERRHALTHELAHIRRHDYLSATLAHLACAIHWYNPLVWLAAQQSRKLQEQACDDLVLRSGAMPSDYASFLVRAAESAQGESNALAAAMGVARHSELRERVDSILDPTRPRAPLSRASVFATSIPAACLALLLAASIPGSPAHTFDVREGEITPLPALPALPRPPETPPAPPPLPPQEPVPPVEAVPATPPDLPNPTNEGIRA
jgi:beta-lactamase regulating signal transducer with metallopeptidase domain